jgi:hypothetical protein
MFITDAQGLDALYYAAEEARSPGCIGVLHDQAKEYVQT